MRGTSSTSSTITVDPRHESKWDVTGPIAVTAAVVAIIALGICLSLKTQCTELQESVATLRFQVSNINAKIDMQAYERQSDRQQYSALESYLNISYIPRRAIIEPGKYVPNKPIRNDLAIRIQFKTDTIPNPISIPKGVYR